MRLVSEHSNRSSAPALRSPKWLFHDADLSCVKAAVALRHFALLWPPQGFCRRGADGLKEKTYALGHPAVAAHPQVKQRESIVGADDVRFAVGGVVTKSVVPLVTAQGNLVKKVRCLGLTCRDDSSSISVAPLARTNCYAYL